MERKRVFNTFVRGETVEEILHKVNLMGEKVKWMRGQLEEGDDNGMLHAQLIFGFKDGKTLGSVQKMFDDCNVQITREPVSMLKYCTNSNKRYSLYDSLIVFGDIPNFKSRREYSANDLILILQDAPTLESGLKSISEKDAFFYIKNKKYLTDIYLEEHPENEGSLFKPEDFTRPLHDLDSTQMKNKVLVLIGDTGLGKTQYALAHFKNPVHVRHAEDYRRFNHEKHDGLVMDDLGFKQWSPMTFLKTLEMETAITMNVKYGSARIPRGTKRIICVNSEELLWPDGILPETRAACERRMHKIIVHNHLFNKL